MLFLASDPLLIAGNPASGVVAGGLLAVLIAMIAVVIVYALAWYIFAGFAYMAVAKKAKQDMPGLAWIPGFGPLIIAFRASKMSWWPWLLLIGALIPFISFIFGIAFVVFAVIWHWKMFEKIGKPGWWAILMLIPIVNFVIIGIAAWSKK